jgi:hypothetical protein
MGFVQKNEVRWRLESAFAVMPEGHPIAELETCVDPLVHKSVTNAYKGYWKVKHFPPPERARSPPPSWLSLSL